MLILIGRSSELQYRNIQNSNDMRLLINFCNQNERRKDKVLKEENHFYVNRWELNIQKWLTNFQKHGILQIQMVIEQQENRFKFTEIHSVQILSNSKTQSMRTKLKSPKTLNPQLLETYSQNHQMIYQD